MYRQGAAQAQGYKDPKGDQGPKDQEKGRGASKRLSLRTGLRLGVVRLFGCGLSELDCSV